MKQKRILELIIASCFLIVTLIGSSQQVFADTPNDFNIGSYQADAKAAVVLDAQSGQVLYAKQAHEVLPVASMSKMLSLYLVLQAIHQGRVQWSDTVVPNEAQANLSKQTELSNVPLTANTAYTVADLYQASWIYSANVAVMLLAQKVAGSQEAFVQQMNAQLQRWGVKDAQIVNVSGLNNDLLGDLQTNGTAPHAENGLSAYEVALIAQHLLQDYPEVLQTTKLASATFAKGQADQTDMKNWNLLLPGNALADDNLPVDGLKTGTSDAAGECFTATLPVGKRRLISVVMNAHGASADKSKRFVATKNLLTQVLDHWQYQTLTTKNQALPGQPRLQIKNGVQQHVTLVAKQNFSLWQPKAEPAQGHVQLNKRVVEAPVAKTKIVGYFQLGNQAHFVSNPASIQIGTRTKVQRLPWYQIFWRQLQSIF